ncbi:MAG: 50S ribosomal protein L22 [Candidatus Peribacteraceae bacterium]|nr:50S ribosomal protein L22 [Candidatus Peribacteraceae bacterium]
MHAYLHSARLAPKKANLMAKMIRGMPVPDAIELLRKTHKKSARFIEGVIQSAAANAGHNFKQDAQTMIVKTIVVNQGTAYRRGVPMARGRVRPIRKFMCHISVTLGFNDERKPTSPKKPKKPTKIRSSQTTSTPVKDSPVAVKKSGKSSDSSDSSVSSDSSISSVSSK